MIVASKKERASYYLFLVPAFVIFGVFIFWPTVHSFYLSLCKYSLSSIKSPEFIGLDNFTTLFKNKVFWQAMKNTAIYTLFTVPFLLAAGLFLALLIHNKLVKHKNIYKTIYYIPYVSSMVAVAIVFKLIFDPGSSGIVNQILMKLGMEPMAFLSDNTWAMVIVILLSIWKSLGYIMIIYLGVFSVIKLPSFTFMGFIKFNRFFPGVVALGMNSGAYLCEIIRSGMQSIDGGQNEAARSLGLSSFQTLLYIIMPQAIRNILPPSPTSSSLSSRSPPSSTPSACRTSYPPSTR